MSRHHIATHAYDFRRGWVRIPPTPMTPERAMSLADQGFTIVRSRRGWFGVRELTLSWYLRHTVSDRPDPAGISVSPAPPSAKLQDAVDETTEPGLGVDLPGPGSPGRRRGRASNAER